MENNLVRTAELLGSKKNIVGGTNADLILETLGKIYIKSGKKTQLLNDVFKLLDQIDINSGGSKIIITHDLTNLKYPGDGFLVFDTSENSLYIAYDMRYLLVVDKIDPFQPESPFVKKRGDVMTGQLKITHKGAPLVVASKELVKNFNANYFQGHDTDYFAVKELDEFIYGSWSFDKNTLFMQNVDVLGHGSIGGDLQVSNNAIVGGDSSVYGNQLINKNLTVFGQAEVKDNAQFRKNVVVNGDIITDGSIGSPMFMSGYNGYGWRFEADTNMLTVDYLVVRKAMHVFELVVNQISATNGSLWVTDSGEIEEVFDVQLLPLNSEKRTKLVEIPKYYSKYVEEVIDGAVVGNYQYVEYIPTHSNNKLLCDYEYVENQYFPAIQGEESAKYAKVFTENYNQPTVIKTQNKASFNNLQSQYTENYFGNNLLKNSSFSKNSDWQFSSGSIVSNQFIHHNCWHNVKSSTTSPSTIFQVLEELNPDTQYFLSFWVRGSSSTPIALKFQIIGHDNTNLINPDAGVSLDGEQLADSDGIYYSPNSNVWSRHYIKFKTIEDLSEITDFKLLITHYEGEVQLSLLKLEEGDLSAWSWHQTEFPNTNLNLLNGTATFDSSWDIKEGIINENSITYASQSNTQFLKQSINTTQGWYTLSFEAYGNGILGILIPEVFDVHTIEVIIDGQGYYYIENVDEEYVRFNLTEVPTIHTVTFYSSVSTVSDLILAALQESTVTIKNLKLEEGVFRTNYYVSQADLSDLNTQYGINQINYFTSIRPISTLYGENSVLNKEVGKYLNIVTIYNNNLRLCRSIFIENQNTSIPTYIEQFILTSVNPTHIKNYRKLQIGDVYSSNKRYFAYNKETSTYEEAVTKYLGDKEIVATHIKDGDDYREPTTKDGVWYIPYIPNVYNHEIKTINESNLVSSSVKSDTAFDDVNFNVFKYLCKFKSKHDLLLMSPQSDELDITNTEYIDKVGILFKNSESTELNYFWQNAEYEPVQSGGTHIEVAGENGTYFRPIRSNEQGTHKLKEGTDQYNIASGTNVATHMQYGYDQDGNPKYITLEQYNVLNPVISENLMLNTNYTSRSYVIPRTEPFNDSSRIYEMFQYYKYFGNKSLYVDNIKIIKMKEDKIPPFKEGDLVRCQKYQDGNIKYYDALIANKVGAYEYIIITAESVFDKQTTVSYNDDGSVAEYKEELNKSQYEKTPQNKDGTITAGYSDVNNEDFDEDELIAGVASGDGIVRIGHMYDVDRQNSVYITSSELDSPYIQTMSGVSRPDYSVLYSEPDFITNDRGWFQFSVGNFPIIEETINGTTYGQIRVRSHKGWDWCKVTRNDKGEKLFYYNSVYCFVLDENNTLQIHRANYNLKIKTNTNVRTRLGNLNGITDPLFSTKQPYGYGLFADNVFLKGEFYLNNGQTVVEFSKEQALIESKKITLGAIGGSLDNIFINSDYDSRDYWQEKGIQYQEYKDDAKKLNFIMLNGNREYQQVNGSYLINNKEYFPNNGIVEVITKYILEETDDYKFIYLDGATITQKALKSVITKGPIKVQINVDRATNYSAVLNLVDVDGTVLKQTAKIPLERGVIERSFDIEVDDPEHRLVLVITPTDPSIDASIAFKNEFASHSALNTAYIKILPDSITQTVKNEFDGQFTQIKQDMTSISSTVSGVDDRVTELKQTVDSFTFGFNNHNLYKNWKERGKWYYFNEDWSRITYTPTIDASEGHLFTPVNFSVNRVITEEGNLVVDSKANEIVVEIEKPLPQLLIDSDEDVYLEQGQKLQIQFDFICNSTPENIKIVLLSESLETVGELNAICAYDQNNSTHISNEIEIIKTFSGALTLGIAYGQPIIIKDIMVGTDYSSFFEISSKGITSSFLEKGNILSDASFNQYKNLLDWYNVEQNTAEKPESPWIYLNGVNGQTFTGQISEETYKDSICIYGDSQMYPEKQYIELMKQAIPNKLKPCTWYTLSFWAKGDFIYDENDTLISSPGIYSYIYVSGKSIGDKQKDNYKSYTISDQWTRYTYTFKTVRNLETSLDINVLFRLPVLSSDTCKYRNAYITMPQLEEGKTASTWNANSKDVTTILEASTDGIKLALNTTGINIDEHIIALNAENTIINGDLTVNSDAEGGIELYNNQLLRTKITNKDFEYQDIETDLHKLVFNTRYNDNTLPGSTYGSGDGIGDTNGVHLPTKTYQSFIDSTYKQSVKDFYQGIVNSLGFNTEKTRIAVLTESIQLNTGGYNSVDLNNVFLYDISLVRSRLGSKYADTKITKQAICLIGLNYGTTATYKLLECQVLDHTDIIKSYTFKPIKYYNTETSGYHELDIMIIFESDSTSSTQQYGWPGSFSNRAYVTTYNASYYYKPLTDEVNILSSNGVAFSSMGSYFTLFNGQLDIKTGSNFGTSFDPKLGWFVNPRVSIAGGLYKYPKIPIGGFTRAGVNAPDWSNFDTIIITKVDNFEYGGVDSDGYEYYYVYTNGVNGRKFDIYSKLSTDIKVYFRSNTSWMAGGNVILKANTKTTLIYTNDDWYVFN